MSEDKIGEKENSTKGLLIFPYIGKIEMAELNRD